MWRDCGFLALAAGLAAPICTASFAHQRDACSCHSTLFLPSLTQFEERQSNVCSYYSPLPVSCLGSLCSPTLSSPHQVNRTQELTPFSPLRCQIQDRKGTLHR